MKANVTIHQGEVVGWSKVITSSTKARIMAEVERLCIQGAWVTDSWHKYIFIPARAITLIKTDMIKD
jgi:hypothetical protein